MRQALGPGKSPLDGEGWEFPIEDGADQVAVDLAGHFGRAELQRLGAEFAKTGPVAE